MRRSLPLVAALLAVCAVPAFSRRSDDPKPAVKAESKPEDAQKLMDAAMKKAKDQKKNLFILFDASW